MTSTRGCPHFELIVNGDDAALGDRGVAANDFLHLAGREAVTGDIDHVINPTLQVRETCLQWSSNVMSAVHHDEDIAFVVNESTVASQVETLIQINQFSKQSDQGQDERATYQDSV